MQFLEHKRKCLQLMAGQKSKFPPGTQSGKIFRLKGKGFPSINSHEKGDQLIHVNVWTPQNVSADEKANLRKNAGK